MAYLDAALQQFVHPLRAIIEVGQQVADAAQIGGLGQRALHPAHHRHAGRPLARGDAGSPPAGRSSAARCAGSGVRS